MKSNSNTFHNQQLGTAQRPSEGENKQSVVHQHNEYYSAGLGRNSANTVNLRWGDAE